MSNPITKYGFTATDIGKTKTVFHVDQTTHGYNHDVLCGHYEGDCPTIEQIEAQFYHEYFGGRHPWVDPLTKKFGVTVHGCD